MSKDKVVVFTSSGGFAMPTTHEKKTEKPQYIQATGGDESTVTVHDKCGTPECCGMCESAKDDQSLASIIYENKDMDEEFSDHCNRFFKGKLIK